MCIIHTDAQIFQNMILQNHIPLKYFLASQFNE